MFTATQDYTLRTETENSDTRYFVSFTDGKGNTQDTEVSQAVYEEMQSLDRYERKLQRRDERHLEHFSLTENQLHKRAAAPSKSAEDIVFENWQSDRLWDAIDSLPEAQQRRSVMYYVDGMTCAQIAAEEGCAVAVVHRAIKKAKARVKNLFLQGGVKNRAFLWN